MDNLPPVKDRLLDLYNKLWVNIQLKNNQVNGAKEMAIIESLLIMISKRFPEYQDDFKAMDSKYEELL